MSAFLHLLFLILLTSAKGADLFAGFAAQQELFFAKEQIRIVSKLLQKDCPELVTPKIQTYLGNIESLELDTAKSVYNDLLKSLTQCEAKTTPAKVEPTTKSYLTSKDIKVTPPATKKPTTTELLTPKDCQELYERGSTTSGIYLIDPLPGDLKPFQVQCDFFDGHGWTVFQKRFNGKVDFYRGWTDYEDGFGDIAGEHWLGLEKLHALTLTNRKMNLRVKSNIGSTKSGTWSSFSVSNATDKYRLHISNAHFEGDLNSKGLVWHTGMQFSTKDRDNDISSSSDCAERYHGAWWYKNCHRSNLNGEYNNHSFSGVWWYGFSLDIIETLMRVGRE